MRKREIHSVAHWAMMFILLMFPLLMVVVGAFQNGDYEPEKITTHIDNTSLQINDRYTFMTGVATFSNQYNNNNYFEVDNVVDVNDFTDVDLSTCNRLRFYMTENNQTIFFQHDSTELVRIFINNTQVVCDFTFLGYSDSFQTGILPYWDYVYQIEYIDNYHYKNDVNLWTKSFLDLPINSWYKSLMNVIGVGFTNSSVMNVIYVMPVYILWVFIFDVIVDCFLVIIKLPHKLLNRLSGGENE